MCASKNKKPKKRGTKQKERHQTKNKESTTTDHENKGMTNKYVTTPCILHIPRYTCVGEETKYVVKEGAKGTTPHAKKNDEPTRTP